MTATSAVAYAVPAAVAGAGARGILRNTRKDNFPEWFREVIEVARLAESSEVPGCMIYLPRAVALWDQIKAGMDRQFQKEKCCDNYYFPLFIPASLFAREAAHVEHFAQECALVTHSRMKCEDGKMVPDPTAKLEDPLIVRPTSELIIGEFFRKSIRNAGDLPFQVNQWCNVVRMERATRPFLRTTEFYWQEGHCVFANEEEAKANALKMGQLYAAFMSQSCALPVIFGEKSPGERFAGAAQTLTCEAMMQDGKAVQAGTSHYLGQTFARASDIKFRDKDGIEKLAHTTSWGVSTRLIGCVIMTHSDDDGLRLPPGIAPQHVTIVPAGKASAERDAYITRVQNIFDGARYGHREISVDTDERPDVGPGEKLWDAVKNGVPIRLEVGLKEAKAGTVTVYRRDADHKEKTVVKIEDLAGHVITTLGEIQANYLRQATEYRDTHICEDITTLAGMRAYFSDPANTGFVRAKWFVDKDTETMLKDLHVTIRCLPLDGKRTEGTCVLTGRPTTQDAIFGRSY